MRGNPSNDSPTSEEGSRQVISAPRTLLATFGAGGGAGGAIRFRMKTPDRRCSFKFSVYGVPVTGTPAAFLAARGLTIWVAEVERDETLSGWVPCTDLDGSTQAAPIAIPKSAGLGGYSLETDTMADGIEGLITVPAQVAGTAGSLYLKSLCQPRVQQIIPWSQWSEIESEFGCEPLADALVT